MQLNSNLLTLEMNKCYYLPYPLWAVTLSLETLKVGITALCSRYSNKMGFITKQ